MKPTLVVLAAGMGSRYGGLKQLDGVGPSGQTIMDYSIYDAMQSGFGKVVFVIRRDFEDQFRKQIVAKYADHIPVEVAFQELTDLPEGYVCPSERERPWGTNHAVMAARHAVAEPFAVINSDDFYGRQAFRELARFLQDIKPDKKGRYAMVAFKVGNTTSDNGEVSRGVCTVDASGHLTNVVERGHISVDGAGKVQYVDEKGESHELESSTPVSMNFWGFTPDYFKYSVGEFRRFLDKYIAEPKREFYIPSVVDKFIKDGLAEVTVLTTDSQWFGVTYADDRAEVESRLAALHQAGQYPDDMFAKK